MTREIPENGLLRLLKPADRDLLLPGLQPIPVAAGDVLYEPGDDVGFVYFPGGPALVSFMVAFEDGNSVECALIGREGAVGGIVSRGELPAYSRTVVQYPGTLWRTSTRTLQAAKEVSPALDGLFARYADCLLAQIFQSVACGAAHSVEQRTARWLLSAQDRTGDDAVPITQQRLGDLLGVGRSYVSRVVSHLKDDRAIAVSAGSVEILDRHRLECHACRCTDAVRTHFDRVLSGVYPPGKE
ncbi:Crp/Fnr family transcriptional regulator [Polymorphobacter sp.]|uniref:Crp/Fnr family transcriptional regulator n=1 Tax=Polymorphobacter sp. TaxID=1909290 RepID=UPI003F7021AB